MNTKRGRKRHAKRSITLPVAVDRQLIEVRERVGIPASRQIVQALSMYWADLDRRVESVQRGASVRNAT